VFTGRKGKSEGKYHGRVFSQLNKQGVHLVRSNMEKFEALSKIMSVVAKLSQVA
jgi:hypothetical protein